MPSLCLSFLPLCCHVSIRVLFRCTKFMYKAALKMKPNQDFSCFQKQAPPLFWKDCRLQIWGHNSLGLWTHMLHCTNFCCLWLALALCHDYSVSLFHIPHLSLEGSRAHPRTHRHRDTHTHTVFICILDLPSLMCSLKQLSKQSSYPSKHA